MYFSIISALMILIVFKEKAKDDLPEDIKYDFYEILAGRRKEMAELGEDAQQDDEGEGGEEEEEEEGPPKRKGVPNYDGI